MPTAPSQFKASVLRKPYTLPVGFSLAVYIVSFFMPVFDSGTPQVMYGYQAFVLAIFSKFLLCWFANPIYWFACHQALTGNLRSARNYALMALVLSASQIWMMDDNPERGFYLWVASMAILVIPLTVNQTIIPLHSQSIEESRR